MIDCSLVNVASYRDVVEFFTGSAGVSVDTAAVALGRGISLVLALVLIPAFVLSLLVPFFFLAAWIARKPPKFIKQDKWLGIYIAAVGSFQFAIRLMEPDLAAFGLALWQIFWGLMLVWAAKKRATAPLPA
jgi:hypothetical protein